MSFIDVWVCNQKYMENSCKYGVTIQQWFEEKSSSGGKGCTRSHQDWQCFLMCSDGKQTTIFLLVPYARVSLGRCPCMLVIAYCMWCQVCTKYTLTLCLPRGCLPWLSRHAYKQPILMPILTLSVPWENNNVETTSWRHFSIDSPLLLRRVPAGIFPAGRSIHAHCMGRI
jgi:hypothetical protein